MFNFDGLRKWQAEGLDVFQNSSNKNPLTSACPGAGKTRYASRAASGLSADIRSKKSRPFVVIVVPTKHLKKQWASAMREFEGLKITGKVKREVSGRPDAYDGMIVTYCGLAGVLNEIKTWKGQGWKIFSIFDEVHHSSVDASWGASVTDLGEISERSMLLSGTPFRSDGGKIPLVEYDQNGISCGYSYSYKQAVADRVCRRIEFIPFHAEIVNERRMPDGQLIVEEFKWNPDFQMPESDEARVIRLGLDSAQRTVRDMVALARDRLSIIQKSDAGAAAIIHALGGINDSSLTDGGADERFLDLVDTIAKRHGLRTTKVSSKDKESSALIKRFSLSSASDCLTSIRQVSEGVDIKRARLGVYMTNITTEMYFRQAVGRYVRWNPNLGDGQFGMMIYPATPTLTRYATQIEDEAKVGILNRPNNPDAVDGCESIERQHATNIVQMSEGVGSGLIARGEFFDGKDKHLEAAKELHDSKHHDIPISVIASILRDNHELNSGGNQSKTATVLNANIESEEDEIERICGKGGEMFRLIRACMEKHPQRFEGYNRIHAELNRLQGVPKGTRNGQEYVRMRLGIKGIRQRSSYLKEILEGKR